MKHAQHALVGWLVRGVAAAAVAGSCTSLFGAPPVGSQVKTIDLTAANLAKASNAILSAAKTGTTQQLLVQLDAEDIFADEAAKRQQRDIDHNDQAILGETRAALAARKQEVFPSGRVGSAQITQDFDNLPLVVITVSDYASLTQVLNNPRVKLVSVPRQMRPVLAVPVARQQSALMASNPSIERTSYSRLRLLTLAAHVER